MVNAAHAIGDALRGSGELGSIRVATYQDGDHVVISVADTGTGIPENVARRVFEPFFTTKPVGTGTGIGLSVSRGMITAMGGTIEVDPRPGEGARFTITLPAAEAPGTAAVGPAMARAPRPVSAR